MDQVYTYNRGSLDGSPEVVSLSVAKQNSNIDHSDQDELLGVMLSAAVDYCENHCAIDILPRTGTIIETNCWANKLYLPCGPVYGDVVVEYKDAAGDYQTVISSDYQLKYFGGQITPVIMFSLYSFPELNAKDQTPIKITVNTGFEVANMPAAIKQAVLLLFSKNETWREDTPIKGNRSVSALLRPFKKQ